MTKIKILERLYDKKNLLELCIELENLEDFSIKNNKINISINENDLLKLFQESKFYLDGSAYDYVKIKEENEKLKNIFTKIFTLEKKVEELEKYKEKQIKHEEYKRMWETMIPSTDSIPQG